MPSAPLPRLSIRANLHRLEKSLRRLPHGRPYGQDAADAAGISRSGYGELKMRDAAKRREPLLRQLLGLARFFRVPPLELFDAFPPDLLYERRGVAWRVAGPVAGPREEAMRRAAVGVLEGETPEDTGRAVNALWRPEDGRRSAVPVADLRWMARGAFALGLVELAPGGRRESALDPGLADRLAAALAQATPDGRRPSVRVVRNLAHAGFRYDPSAPYLIAQAAHALVADFLRAHRGVYTVGIAGGMLVSAFVHSIGASSSPFPDSPGSDKRLEIVPLTLEPMSVHRYWLADALVGELAARGSYLLGPDRVKAFSFKPFGYLVGRSIDSLSTDAVSNVRAQYPELPVAVFGCGDRTEDGWFNEVLRDEGFEPGHAPHTDVCLNMLAEDGTPIPLPPAEKRQREYLGVGLRTIRRIAGHPEKLALLLTSGSHKGSPLVTVFRAGCANAVICDEAAAGAALARLEVEARPPGRRRGRKAEKAAQPVGGRSAHAVRGGSA